ncbi:MAG: histidinol-phosphatase [Alphaproteobacteria bacterium]|nr:histidinol-phosphatase [Alphaproteobacteria bacterium]
MFENNEQFHRETGIDPEAIAVTLLRAARAADNETLPRFRTKITVDNKYSSGFDPVTKADTEAERAIRAIVETDFPGHAIIGEEHGNKVTDSLFAWVIDPVDGTRSFITGVPLWGTLIGVTYAGKAVAGIMSQPFTGEVFLGLPGRAEWRRGEERQALATSGCADIAAARLFTTAETLFRTPAQKAAWESLARQALLIRHGADCYAYCMLAAGHADLVMEPGLHPFDIAALVPIIEQAGGAIAAWNGGPADNGGDIIAAATPELLDKALERIASSQRG